MQRKPDLTTNEVIKHKARLNLHGGKQVYGMNYFETYAPVVTWFAIRLMILFGIMFYGAPQQVDFVLVYPQAPVEMDIYMELPQGIKPATGNSKDHVLKLLKNIYGQKQVEGLWNSFLVDKLTSLGFTSLLIDDCVFFRSEIILMVYVDDGIFLGNDDVQLLQAIKEIQDLGLNIKDQSHPADYVGVNIKKHRNGFYEFTQHALNDSIIIIKDSGISNSKTKPVLAKVSLQLHAFKNEQVFDLDFNYRSVVGKLKYLAQITHPDINVCYYHFCKHVQKGLIKIFPIHTKDQIADALTKPLAQNDFQRHHCLMCGK
jgi:hypothetical protein